MLLVFFFCHDRMKKDKLWRTFKRSQNTCIVRHVKRKANFAAHGLAKFRVKSNHG
jgi:hypothetical protein